MTYKRGWSNVKGYRCRAAHRVDPNNNTRAICDAPVRTLVRPKGAPWDYCDKCDAVIRRNRRKK